MKIQIPPNPSGGFALMMVLIFSAISLMILGASMEWTSTTSNLNERFNQRLATQLAAESATEKAMAAMLNDFKNYGQPGIGNNLYSYGRMLPTVQEDAYWSQFEFNDARGVDSSIYVQPYGSQYYTNDLGAAYGGLGGTRIPYRIVANARMMNGRFAMTNAAQQEVAFTTIPIFQFAIFYNGLLEFTRSAPMEIWGRVHANSPIYVGTLSGSFQKFHETVTTVGEIQQKANWMGMSSSSYGGTVTYDKGKTTNATALTLPIGLNNDSASLHKIIEPPAAGESPLSALGKERYYNKADLLVIVDNSGVHVGAKTPFSTSSNNIAWAQSSYFISTNNSFYDQRDGQSQILTEIDVGKLKTWVATNSTVISTLGAGNTPSILYVEDRRGGTVYSTNVVSTTKTITTSSWPGSGVGTITTNLSDWTPASGLASQSSIPSYAFDWRTTTVTSGSKKKKVTSTVYQYRVVNDFSYTTTTYATNVTSTVLGRASVRLVNGQTLPDRGLTVATPNGLYIKGNYNCPNTAHLGTTNTSSAKPASLIADATTFLSANWSDTSGTSSYTTRTPVDTTVNAAVISGNVPTGGATGDSPQSGGVHNLPRMLENWGSSKVLTINGSMVCIFESQMHDKPFISPGAAGQYYTPPVRNWSFDKKFLDPNNLPPGTPAVRVMERMKWSTPPINTVTYNGY